MDSVYYMEVALNALIGLTPTQRWEAAGRGFDSGFMAQKWFVILGIAMIVVLSIAFVCVNYQRRKREQDSPLSGFYEIAYSRGLSEHQQQLLLEVSLLAGLRQTVSIFSLASAFDRGAACLVDNIVTRQGIAAANKLKCEIIDLREKLGYKTRKQTTSTKTQNLTSRLIPEGKKLFICRASDPQQHWECTVTSSDDVCLSVDAPQTLGVNLGERWRARYYSGTNLWEFDSTVLGSEGCKLIFKHSDNVRFVNRRRFARVAVELPAKVAIMPFEKISFQNQDQNQEVNLDIEPPKFMDAVVTELAGPGIKLNMPVFDKNELRLVVLFAIPSTRNDGKVMFIQDIAHVRHVGQEQGRMSVAVELVSINDNELDRLVSLTNMLQRAGQDESEASQAMASQLSEVNL